MSRHAAPERTKFSTCRRWFFGSWRCLSRSRASRNMSRRRPISIFFSASPSCRGVSLSLSIRPCRGRVQCDSAGRRIPGAGGPFFPWRRQTAMVDAPDLRFPARRLAACGDELSVVRGLRLACGPPLWGAALFAGFARARPSPEPDALRDPHRGSAAGRRRLGRGFRGHGGGGAFRVSTGRAAWRSPRLFGARAGGPCLSAARRSLCGTFSANRSAISFLGFWFLANFLFGTIPCRLASRTRRWPGKPISAAFSSGFWPFAGSTRPIRPSPLLVTIGPPRRPPHEGPSTEQPPVFPRLLFSPLETRDNFDMRRVTKLIDRLDA